MVQVNIFHPLTYQNKATQLVTCVNIGMVYYRKDLIEGCQYHMDLKRQAARQALEYVRNGMALGLGTGSTARHFVDLLGRKIMAGGLVDIQAVPTSLATAEQARKMGIRLTTLSEHRHLDLVVDGADDVDPNLNLIKGLGRAALREKIVAIHATQFIIIVDESKLVQRLGESNPLPVEITPYEVGAHVRWLNSLGCRAEQWFETDGSPVVTDNGNYLVRCWFQTGIDDPYELDRTLLARPGVLEHGLFLDMADRVIVAAEKGVYEMESER